LINRRSRGGHRLSHCNSFEYCARTGDVFCSVSVQETALGRRAALFEVGHLARCCDSDPGGERREDLGIPPFKSARTSCDNTLWSTPETMPSVDLPRWVGRGTILCAEDGRGCRFTTGFQRADFTRGYPLLAKLGRPHRKANRGLLLALCALGSMCGCPKLR